MGLSLSLWSLVLCWVGCARACFDSSNGDLVGWEMVVVVFVVEGYDGDGGCVLSFRVLVWWLDEGR